MNWFAIGTALLLLAGWLYQANAFPTKMPLQVIQFAPPQPAIAEEPVFAKAEGADAGARYDPATKTMTMDVNVTNTGTAPMELKQFNAAYLGFKAGTTPGPGVVTVTPGATVEPGATTRLTLTMKDPAWENELLVPIGESQLLVTGIMVFENTEGKRNLTEVEANLQPRFA
jgi:methane/ammonia monooxygenase subunit B